MPRRTLPGMHFQSVPAQLAARFGLAMATSLGAILVLERRRLAQLGGNILFLRWRTWLLAEPLYAGAVLLSPWSTLTLAAGLAGQGAREYAGLFGLPAVYRRGLVTAAAVSPVVALFAPRAWLILPAALAVLATLVPLAAQDTDAGVRHLAYASLGFALVGWPLGVLVLVRQHVASGVGVLVVIGAAVAAADVGAFVAGKALGRHPLARRLSPAKTWEGLIGALAGAEVGVHQFAFVLPATMGPGLRAALPLMVALGCTWGDLTESLLKRHAGVKDAGRWLPGFGGLLDRIDSLLVVLPITGLVLTVAS